MSQQDGLSGFKQKLADANPDDEITVDERPEEAEPEPWHGLYWDAWDALRYDRQYLMGGETPISYAAISRYARDNGIAGEDFETFHQMLTAIDDEWLEHAARKRKEEADK